MLTNKLSSLRAHMRDIGVKFFLVLSNDAHASEYVSASDGKDKKDASVLPIFWALLITADTALALF
jgi:hypothetical protein